MVRASGKNFAAETLQNTVCDLRAKLIPSLHAQAILETATTRLEQLMEEQAQLIQLRPWRITPTKTISYILFQ
jgi:hypothetical protein